MLHTLICYLKSFGIKTTFQVLFYPKILSVCLHKDDFVLARPHIRKYIHKEIEEAILHNKKLNEKCSPIEKDSPIWFCWWQGMENMPELAKLCYNYLKFPTLYMVD